MLALGNELRLSMSDLLDVASIQTSGRHCEILDSPGTEHRALEF
ncbi:hypothetical protein SAMN05216367_4864 [Tardiphaga sp. OK245]|nr:hypothetical protein SAMN05216367_4864 [Tardiphaga sp. OK245]